MRSSAAQQQVVQEYVEMEMEVVMIIGIHLKKESINPKIQHQPNGGEMMIIIRG
jgi:hypothetical protein